MIPRVREAVVDPLQFYKLDEYREVVPCSMEESGHFQRTAAKVVRQDDAGKKWWVSTVFLGFDHGFGDGPMLLFETMVFRKGKGMDDQDCRRYSTWKEAICGHQETVEKWERE